MEEKQRKEQLRSIGGSAGEMEEGESGLNIKKEIISWVKVVVAAVVLAFVLGNFVLMNAYIPSGSMENTLKIEDHVMGFRLAYLFSEPKRYDVVMFEAPDEPDKDYIKRVIGLPGETVTVKNGRVYINDSKVPLTEPYLKEEPVSIGDGVYEVPEGCYFMLGDNRNNSKDSRAWENKFVKKEKILAKALFRFYPNPKWISTDY